MTALAIITTERAVVIASDGGLYAPDGTMVGVGCKVAMLPDASSLITGRGSRLASSMLVRALAEIMEPITFDCLLRDLPDFMRQAVPVVAEREGGAPRFSVYLGGWSEGRQGFEAWAFRSYDTDEAPACEAARLPECYLAPAGLPQDIAEHFGIRAPVTGETQWRQDPREYALRAVCAMRFCPGGSADDPEGTPVRVLVGAFVQVSVVTRHTVSSHIAHEWPDPIGEKVDMMRGLPAPGWGSVPHA